MKLEKAYLVLCLIAVTFLMLLPGCQVGPSYDPPESHIPDEWKHEQQQEMTTLPEVCYWWELFDDELLNGLEALALQYNNDLYAALDRVAQARALAGIAAADLYPQLNLNPSYTNEAVLEKLFGPKPMPPQLPPPKLIREHQITNLLPLNLSYELDLWGQIRSTFQSALYHAQSQQAAFYATMLVLTADVADSYFRMRTFDAQLDMYAETIETRKKALSITTSRYEGKLVNYSDVSRAKLELSNVEAEYYQAKWQRDVEEDRIAVLIGMPASELALEHNPLKGEPPVIPADVPSDILIQRPDIAQAERERASDHALIRAAYASFYPSISLTGILGFSSPDLKHFLDWKSRLWGVGATASQFIYDGGRKESNLELSWARFQEADREYQQIVLEAFQEVEDALSALEWYYLEGKKLAESVEAATETLNIASDRYYQGVTFYLDVVDSERDKLIAQRAYIGLQGLRFSATIHLIKALGGRWTLRE